MLIYLQMIESEEDKAKFEQLYCAYRQKMYAVAYSFLHNQSDAEDAVHQAFVSIIENLHNVHKVDCPKTRSYIVLITERKAIDILRDRKRISSEEMIEAFAGVEIELPIDGGLGDAIAGLPAQYRELILLRFAYGYSTKEIGVLMGKTPGTVQRQLWRAKDALQKQLERMGETKWTEPGKNRKKTTASATES